MPAPLFVVEGAAVVVLVVVPAFVVVVVVVGPAVVLVPGFVVAGAEAAACAGGITAFTTGFTHLLGITTAVATPPIMTNFKTCRRSIPGFFVTHLSPSFKRIRFCAPMRVTSRANG